LVPEEAKETKEVLGTRDVEDLEVIRGQLDLQENLVTQDKVDCQDHRALPGKASMMMTRITCSLLDCPALQDHQASMANRESRVRKEKEEKKEKLVQSAERVKWVTPV